VPAELQEELSTNVFYLMVYFNRLGEEWSEGEQ
jgi:hypothetical protein